MRDNIKKKLVPDNVALGFIPNKKIMWLSLQGEAEVISVQKREKNFRKTITKI